MRVVFTAGHCGTVGSGRDDRHQPVLDDVLDRQHFASFSPLGVWRALLQSIASATPNGTLNGGAVILAIGGVSVVWSDGAIATGAVERDAVIGRAARALVLAAGTIPNPSNFASGRPAHAGL